MALLCNTIAGRAALTALSWFFPGQRAFDADRLDLALAFLDAEPSPQLMAAIERMRCHMRRQRKSMG